MATPPATTEAAPETPQRSVRRQDIQGLRALAVIAIICSHVLQFPSGGFAGVDVFFVISGFVITTAMLREIDLNGRLSLRSFYANRVRRIVPAAVLVLIATGAAAWFLFNRPRAMSTLWDAAYAFFFVGNWRFAAVGTDYLNATEPASPLQHYWSLSVEEQFYLVWPWLVLLAFAFATKTLRRPGRVRVVLGSVMVVIAAASFAYAVWETTTSPAVSYFSTFSRAWELGVGALLATTAGVLARMPLALRFLAGWAGLAGIVASLLLIHESMAFPGPWAAAPVLATALVIAAGVGGPQRHLFPLVNPVSSYLGTISYSLYLWHFPVLVFALMLMPEQSLEVTGIILGATLVLAVMSHYLVEQPLHRSPWLASFAGAPDEAPISRADARDKRQDAWQSWRERFGSRFMLSAIGGVIVVAVVIVTVGIDQRDPTPIAAPVAGVTEDANPEVQLQADLAAALTATEWPDNLSPSLDDVISSTSTRNPAKDCFEVGGSPDFGRCTWGDSDAPNHAYLVGDSTALAYAPAFKAIAESSDGQWRITTVGLYGCRFTEILVQNDGAGVMDSCTGRKAEVASHIVADAPQLVVVSNAFALGQTVTRSDLTVSQLVTSTFAETAKYNAAGKIVYLAAPPLGASLAQCYSPVSGPQACVSAVGQTWQEFATASQTATAAGNFFVTSLPFSCAGNLCPSFAGTIPTRYDSVHFTPAYAEHVAPAIKHALAVLGVM